MSGVEGLRSAIAQAVEALEEVGAHLGADTPDDPWERIESAKHVADEIAALVARAREAGIDDETILAQLQDAAAALREGLT